MGQVGALRTANSLTTCNGESHLERCKYVLYKSFDQIVDSFFEWGGLLRDVIGYKLQLYTIMQGSFHLNYIFCACVVCPKSYYIYGLVKYDVLLNYIHH